MAVRAKFRCASIRFNGSIEPQEVTRYTSSTGPGEKSMTWPRTFEFFAVYDNSTPENMRYAQATPYAKLEMNVDNPAVSFEPGRVYYVDFTPAEA